MNTVNLMNLIDQFDFKDWFTCQICFNLTSIMIKVALILLKTDRKWNRQCQELAILLPFLAIFLPTTVIAFTKLRFWRSFWNAQLKKNVLDEKLWYKTQFLIALSFLQFCKKELEIYD